MKKKLIIIIVISLLLISGCDLKSSIKNQSSPNKLNNNIVANQKLNEKFDKEIENQKNAKKQEALDKEVATVSSSKDLFINKDYITTMKQDLLVYMMAYPEYVKDVSREGNNVYLLMKSGKKILYDDGKTKGFEEKLGNTDLQDVLEQVYPLYSINKLMDENIDPGRFRSYPLLIEVYGGTQSTTKANLKGVSGGGYSLSFNKNNKAAASLKAAMDEIVALCNKKNGVRSYVFPSSGTYNFRNISGTNRLSPHAFGIAIDLARNQSDYWQWATREQGEKRIASYPKEIVEIFERYNFVWGGKWGHFDILHYEYRPEMLLKARYFGNNAKVRVKWYDGVPLDVDVMEYINKIDKVID